MRRIHLHPLKQGQVRLEDAQAHYLRDVLRLKAGEPIQAFDGNGQIASGEISNVSPDGVVLQIREVHQAEAAKLELTIAAAIPKGARADWMIEKLSEVGTNVFVPLVCARSVVVPAGTGKQQRWDRIASESARQSGRVDVMEIRDLVSLPALLEKFSVGKTNACYLSTDSDAPAIVEIHASALPAMTLLVGPEGGWTDQEKNAMEESGIKGIRLTSTVLRVETAAILGAGILKCF